MRWAIGHNVTYSTDHETMMNEGTRSAVAESAAPTGYEEITDRLVTEFAGVHPAQMVSRCVSAARHGARDVTGSAPTDLVERIARKHLQVLALAAAEGLRLETLGALG